MTYTFKTSPKDLANNTVDDDEDVTSFSGVATDVAIEMVAAKVDGALNLTMVNDHEDFASAGLFKFTRTGGVAFDVNSTVSADDEVDLVIKPFYALLSKYIDANDNSKSVTYTFTYQADGSAAQSTYETQSFTGTLEEDLATRTAAIATTVGATKVEAVQFTGDELNIDDSNYVYYLVVAGDANLAAAQQLDVVDKSDMTFDANTGLVTNGLANNKIAEANNGDIVVTGATLSSEAFKIVAVPKD